MLVEIRRLYLCSGKNKFFQNNNNDDHHDACDADYYDEHDNEKSENSDGEG